MSLRSEIIANTDDLAFSSSWLDISIWAFVWVFVRFMRGVSYTAGVVVIAKLAGWP